MRQGPRLAARSHLPVLGGECAGVGELAEENGAVELTVRS